MLTWAGPGPSPCKHLVSIYAYVCIYVDVHSIFLGPTPNTPIRVIRNTWYVWYVIRWLIRANTRKVVLLYVKICHKSAAHNSPSALRPGGFMERGHPQAFSIITSQGQFASQGLNQAVSKLCGGLAFIKLLASSGGELTFTKLLANLSGGFAFRQ